MRVAAIDMGTNSTRLLVAEHSPGGFRSIERRMVITRLGQGVDHRKAFAPEAVERTVATVADFAATCGELGVEKIRVSGTSAVRDAQNRSTLLDPVKVLTGTEVEVLSGDQEAGLTFLGAMSDLPATDPTLVVDIGGGSTELIVGMSEPERFVSTDIGCVRMFEKHLFSDPPSEDELTALRADVTGILNGVRDALAVTPGTRLVGVAGTVTQLAAIRSGTPLYDPDVTHHLVMSHGEVRQLTRRLESLTYSQRKRVTAMEAGRADVIIAGAEILLAVMELFDAAEVTTSEKDILDGLVIDLLRS